MLMTQPFKTGSEIPGKQDVHFAFPIPRVYEKAQPLRWEYHVLTIDTSEAALPDATQLNELGREGWLLAGVVDQAKTGRSSLVHYYFVRVREE
jgi:hypothetical protein